MKTYSNFGSNLDLDYDFNTKVLGIDLIKAQSNPWERQVELFDEEKHSVFSREEVESFTGLSTMQLRTIVSHKFFNQNGEKLIKGSFGKCNLSQVVYFLFCSCLKNIKGRSGREASSLIPDYESFRNIITVPGSEILYLRIDGNQKDKNNSLANRLTIKENNEKYASELKIVKKLFHEFAYNENNEIYKEVSESVIIPRRNKIYSNKKFKIKESYIDLIETKVELILFNLRGAIILTKEFQANTRMAEELIYKTPSREIIKELNASYSKYCSEYQKAI